MRVLGNTLLLTSLTWLSWSLLINLGNYSLDGRSYWNFRSLFWRVHSILSILLSCLQSFQSGLLIRPYFVSCLPYFVPRLALVLKKRLEGPWLDHRYQRCQRLEVPPSCSLVVHYYCPVDHSADFEGLLAQELTQGPRASLRVILPARVEQTSKIWFC